MAKAWTACVMSIWFFYPPENYSHGTGQITRTVNVFLGRGVQIYSLLWVSTRKKHPKSIFSDHLYKAHHILKCIRFSEMISWIIMNLHDPFDPRPVKVIRELRVFSWVAWVFGEWKPDRLIAGWGFFFVCFFLKGKYTIFPIFPHFF